MQLTSFDQFIITAIVILLSLLIIVVFFNRKREQAKKRAELIFGEEKREKKKKSPNIIFGTLYNFSRAFFNMFPLLKKILPKQDPKALKDIELKLELAGKPFAMDAPSFVMLKYFSALIFFFLLSIIALGNSRYDYFIWAAIFGIVGYFYPNFYIRTLLDQRKRQISRELPDAMDFISLSLAAGMNFQLAVDEYIKRNDTLLAYEFSIFSNNVQVGMSRIEAFQRMLDRNESSELRSFLSSVIQSERLGTPLRPVITSQAAELRIKRRQAIEKAIATAPVKMLFPLILFILPAMMTIIMGSVLLPSVGARKSVTLTIENFLYYRVTPEVKVKINGNDHKILCCKKISTGENFIVVLEPPLVLNSSEENYLKNFFNKNKDLTEAYFVRIELPENITSYLDLEIIAPNRVRSRKLIICKYVKLEMDNFKDTTIESKSKKISFSGRVSVGCRVSLSLNGNLVPLKSFNKDSGEFLSQEATLKSGTNRLNITIIDSTGLSLTVTRYVKYTGVEVRAEFKEKNETFSIYGTLVGKATKNSKVVIKREFTKKKKTLYEEVMKIDVAGEGNFEVKIPLEPGLNKFLIYAEKDGSESPYLRKEITRKLIE